MTHEFKVGQWVEIIKDNFPIVLGGKILNEVGKIVKVEELTQNRSFVYRDEGIGCMSVENAKPLILRDGDYCKTEGMTQEQFDLIRQFNVCTKYSPNITIKNCGSDLTFVDGEWLIGHPLGEEKRRLTIEQILSTLPVEDKTLQSVLGDALKDAGVVSNHDDGPLSGIQPEEDPKTPVIDWTKEIRRKSNDLKTVFLERNGADCLIAQQQKHLGWEINQVKYSDLENVHEEHKLEGWLNIGAEGDHFYTPEKWNCGDYEVSFTGGRIACIDLSKYGITFVKREGLDDE